jgi:hypothetical protein
MEKFFKDKKRIFECTISVEGASIKETTARLLLDFGQQTLMFRGRVSSDGKCTIEVPPLRNIHEETGRAILEVISESSLFEAWESDFELRESKTVKVEKTEDKPIIVESRPKVSAKVVSQPDPLTPIQEFFVGELRKHSINEANYRKHDTDIKTIFRLIRERFSPEEVKSLMGHIKPCFEAAKP